MPQFPARTALPTAFSPAPLSTKPSLTVPYVTRSFSGHSNPTFMDILRYSEAEIPTLYGLFRLFVFHENNKDGRPAPGTTGFEHMAIVNGDIAGQENVLTRIHSECWTSEVMGSLKCDCREQLEVSLKRIADEGQGVVVYLRQEGRGIGLGNKVAAYALQNQGADTVEANVHLGFEEDARTYDIAGAMLKDLGVSSVRLMTNNPLKIEGLEQAGIRVAQREAHWVAENQHSADYLAVKRDKMGHHADAKPVLRAVRGETK